VRRGLAFWAVDGSGRILLRRRPPRGLLGGMLEIPSSPWRAGPMPTLAEVGGAAPVAASWRLLPGLVRHVFTHFELELAVAAGRVAPGAAWPDGASPVGIDGLADAGLPSVMRKVVRHALAHAG
jgi:A/G-specific adenine glycosylase